MANKSLLISEGLGRAAQVIMADISHGAVGTGTTDPTLLDSQLGTETDRVATTKTIRDGNILQHRSFFLNGELPTPNVEEVGWFMNGSGAANSGEMLCRATLTFITSGQDMLLIFEAIIQEQVTS